MHGDKGGSITFEELKQVVEKAGILTNSQKTQGTADFTAAIAFWS
jgi:hypothetical protein